ncbi:MAG: protein O-mannosyl-transferase family, partial [Burkholderiales bacterium]
MSRSALGLLALAIVVGGLLRCCNLGANQLSADEAATWAAVSAPGLGEVAERQWRLNAGKLPVHDFILFGWTRAFGDSEASMRAVSALSGTLAILLVFLVARELLRLDQDRAGAPRDEERDGAAAAGAFVFAISLLMIKYSREARMYPLALCAVLAQVWFFLRSSRTGHRADLAALAGLTALAVAIHFSAMLIPFTEALWILYGSLRAGFNYGDAKTRRALTVAGALAAGGLLLAPAAPAALRGASAAIARGTWNWIAPVAPWEPLAFFNRASGTYAYPLLAALAGLGAIRGWRRAPDAVRFALLWMWTPLLAALIGSYLWRPMFVEKYLLSCMVPFFILAGMGTWWLGGLRMRIAALALLSLLVAPRLQSHFGRPHDAEWREAARAAAAQL